MKRVFGGFSLSGGKQHGGISSFQALATAIAAQVGTGNIVGGKRTLYRGMLFIDVGILTSAMVTGAATYIAICVMIGGVMLDSTEMVVYIYATGVISYGVQRIAAAFRKTAIVYIQ